MLVEQELQGLEQDMTERSPPMIRDYEGLVVGGDRLGQGEHFDGCDGNRVFGDA